MTSVCFVVQSIYNFDPRVRRKAEALTAEGYSVDVLALRPSSGEAQYTLNGVNVRTMPLPKKRGTITRYAFEYAAFFLWATFRLTIQMMQRRYKLIDANSLPDFLVFATLPAKWMGAKVVLDLHEIMPEFYMSRYRAAESALAVRTLAWLEKVSIRFADHVLTISEPVEDLLAGRGLNRSKSTVIMNAADEKYFTSGARAMMEAGAGEPAGFVMMYHGTLTSLYGLDIALKAFALAHEDMPGAEIWILGSGQEKESLITLAHERKISGKVRFVGQVPAREIPAWLNRSDVGLLPIRHDVFLDFAFPNKLPEYIISGKPVIISRLRTVQRYFSDDSLVFFEPNDIKDLARQMSRVYGEAGMRERLAANARREYAPIRWDVMKRRYLALIAHMVGVAQPDKQSSVSKGAFASK